MFRQFESALESYIPADEVAEVLMGPIAGDVGMVVPPGRTTPREAWLASQGFTRI